MGLEVIGAGFGRTGTHSLKIALEHLGFGPCHHMYEVRAHRDQLAYWQAALRGEPVDWDLVFGGYRSQVDWPGAHFWRQLVSHFPDAKVVLTIRDPDAWFESLHKTIFRVVTDDQPNAPDAHNRAVNAFVHDLTFVETFQRRMADRDHAVSAYEAHNRAVRESVPPERLLVYEVSEGWAPICGFLGVPLPSEPFPVTNSTLEFLARKRLI